MTEPSSSFARYTRFDPSVPVFRVTDGRKPVIHRFFDSSPISPTTQYIALTEFPYQDRLPTPGDCAAVIVIDLTTGDEVYRSETAAWDTQVGAQVQWGASDAELYFNRMDESIWQPFGVRVDPASGKEARLGGSVYHVSSDGRYALSPDLVKITVAQAGYGVHVPASRIVRNVGTPADDGIFVTDLWSGECRLLVSLDTIAAAIGREMFADGGVAYSFHTKWNSDASRIMFILRWFPSGTHKSRNWLVTLASDGSDIRVAVSPDQWRDGHHPNWYPTGATIVMNLPSVSGLSGAMRTFVGKLGRKLNLPLGGVPLHFKAVEADGGGLRSLSQHIGSGHPTIHPSRTFLLSDAYLNEQPAYADGSIPLRVVDLSTQRLAIAARIDCKPAFMGAKGEYRIDPHPAWHSQGRWLTFNGSVDGVRSVFIADFADFSLP